MKTDEAVKLLYNATQTLIWFNSLETPIEQLCEDTKSLCRLVNSLEAEGYICNVLGFLGCDGEFFPSSASITKSFYEKIKQHQNQPQPGEQLCLL